MEELTMTQFNEAFEAFMNDRANSITFKNAQDYINGIDGFEATRSEKNERLVSYTEKNENNETIAYADMEDWQRLPQAYQLHHFDLQEALIKHARRLFNREMTRDQLNFKYHDKQSSRLYYVWQKKSLLKEMKKIERDMKSLEDYARREGIK